METNPLFYEISYKALLLSKYSRYTLFLPSGTLTLTWQGGGGEHL